MGPVERLRASIEQHLSAIHDTARGSKAGGGEAWDQLLAHYGLRGFSTAEREMTVQCLGLKTAATPGEMRLVLEALVRWAQAELTQIAADPSSSAGAHQLAYELSSLVDQRTAHYERCIGVVPAPPTSEVNVATPSLGAIFQNAHQTSKEVPWANAKYKQVVMLNCVHCGAPQEQPLDFMCRYCRRPLAGSIKQTL